MKRYDWLAIFAVCVCIFSGCDDGIKPGVVIKGKLLKDGAPIEPIDANAAVGIVQLTLVPQGDSEEFGAIPDEEGLFEFIGIGKGVAPGEYKLEITQGGMDGNDKLKDRFIRERTPITVTVEASEVGGEKDLGVIELSSYK